VCTENPSEVLPDTDLSERREYGVVEVVRKMSCVVRMGDDDVGWMEKTSVAEPSYATPLGMRGPWRRASNFHSIRLLDSSTHLHIGPCDQTIIAATTYRYEPPENLSENPAAFLSISR
jgi:hypothetical protein